MNDQEGQDIDRAVPCIIELALCDRAGDRRPARMAFQDLEVGLLIDTDHPEASTGQPLGVGVAPEDLLGTFLELRVDAGCPPIPRAVRLKVHSMEDVSDRPIADGRDDPIFDRLSSQIVTGPVGDVQALGDGAVGFGQQGLNFFGQPDPPPRGTLSSPQTPYTRVGGGRLRRRERDTWVSQVVPTSPKKLYPRNPSLTMGSRQAN
jgi:hypothetical protein